MKSLPDGLTSVPDELGPLRTAPAWTRAAPRRALDVPPLLVVDDGRQYDLPFFGYAPHGAQTGKMVATTIVADHVGTVW